jgi:hypothetical protein
MRKFISVLLCFSQLWGSTACATQAPPPPPPNPASASTADVQGETDTGWPREFASSDSSGEQITVYQPEVEKWKDNQLEERAAVSVKTPSSAQPTFGVVWIKARTEVDKTNRLVTLEDVQVTKANFPAAPDMTTTYLQLLRKNTPGLVKQISLDRLQASLAIAQAENKTKTPALRNRPPQIIFSQTSAVLVLVDGEPALRESGVPGVLRVINTRSLLVLNQTDGKYYFYMGDRWMRTDQISGPWSQANPPPETLSSLEKVKQAATAQKEMAPDLLNDPNSSLMQELSKGVVPKLYVSTSAAELIQTQGAPAYQPVANTKLLYVQNSANSIFLDLRDQKTYILVSGRWYRAKSLNGPWEYVSPKKLPTDFAKIPDTHPQGTVLTSVAGTPQAQEAGIANDIPQTATVDRAQAQLQVQYDGAPQFTAIQGTPLLYAMNTPVPVVEVDPSSYFAVQNGVWFAATSPQGPWAVADRIPAVIYTIPPSSPLYYVTYVRVYGSSPEVVYVGYTPGYLGSYDSADGVVVYGTGYYYQPWIGSVWYGPPVTYGFGWCWGPDFGWGFAAAFGIGLFAGALFTPWWGPWHDWGWRRGPSVSIREFNVNHANIYRNWSGGAVRNSWGRNEFANRSYHPGMQPGRPNNVYAGRNGSVYRYGNNGWEQHGKQGWQGRSPSPDLEQSRQARNTGEQRWNNFRGSGSPSMGSPSRRPLFGSGGGAGGHGGLGGGGRGGGHGHG